MNIRTRLSYLMMFCLVYLIISATCFAQTNISIKKHSYELKNESRKISSIKFCYSKSDTTEFTQDQLLARYQKVKVNPTTAALLNWFTGPFVAGHYYANAGDEALKYHIIWGAGIGTGVASVNSQNETLLYISVGLITYAWMYASLEAPIIAKNYNLNWRKQHGLIGMTKPISSPYYTIVSINYPL